MNRRHWLTVSGAGMLAAATRRVRAQAYPSKPISIIVGYTAGGAVDLVARAVGQQLTAALGQPVIVDNKPGAGTNIAVKAAIASPPDGYTLMLAANALAANMALYQPAPFDAERQLVPIGLVGRVPVVIAVNAASPLTSVAKLVEAAKAKPGSVDYATPGNGSTPHLAMELFAHAAGITLSHVPYRGGAQALTDVMGGQLQLVALNALELLPHLRSGKLKAIASLSANRSPALPDVPTISESGFPGFEASVWYGLLAPAGTPKAIVTQVNAAMQRALQSAEVKERLSAAGGEVVPGTPEAFGTYLHAERVRYEKLIRAANIKAD
jgi:tripartite-type tricarboxylate transporter receptor subunit TctC